MKKMKITTRGGDGGKTSLGDGTRVDKDDVRVELVGTLDECQANVGMARATAKTRHAGATSGAYNEIYKKLEFIEKEIGALMAHLTLFPGCECPSVEPLEKTISEAEASCENFTFLYPGESKLAAALHIARTVARRAERTAAPLVREGKISEDAARYLNRLSDFFYALALVQKEKNKIGGL